MKRITSIFMQNNSSGN